MSAVEVIAQVGAEQLAATSLSALAVIGIGAAAIAVPLGLIFGAAWLLGRVRPQPGLCPWCDYRDQIDSTLCDCTAPCGRAYCKGPANR